MGKKNQIRRLGVREVRKRLAEMFNDAGQGKVTVVTRKGKALAAVISGQCGGMDIDAARDATSRKVPFKKAMEEVGREDAKALRRLAKL